MGLIISVANQKGGVAKTLTTSCLAKILTEKGYKILCVDMDPQRNLCMTAGEDIAIQPYDTETLSILDALEGRCAAKDAIVQTPLGDLIRAVTGLTQWNSAVTITSDEYRKIKDKYLSALNLLDNKIHQEAKGKKSVITPEEFDALKPDFLEITEFFNDRILRQSEKQTKLLKALTPIKDEYDYILVDSNPSLTLVTLNALYASDYVIVPALCETTSVAAIVELRNTIETITRFDYTRNIKILGVLPTRCEFRTSGYKRYSEVIYPAFQEETGIHIFKTHIRKSVRATDYIEVNCNLIDYDPSGTATKDYRQFTEEFLAEIAKQEGI